MPRRRNTSETTVPADETALTCPECGRSFQRPQALGAHRRHAHGVAGERSRSRAQADNGAGRKREHAAARTAASRTKVGRPRRVGTTSSRTRQIGGNGDRGRRNSLDRDGLLRALFPGGIPANEETIRSVNSWLDEAERLASLR